jgi:hypothetical protein
LVIDQGVHVVEPDLRDLGGAVAGAGGAAVGAPAPALGDAADLLDVHVDQLAGAVAFVAGGGGLAGSDLLTGERVEFTQVRQLVAAQDPRDRPGRHTEFGPDLVLSATIAFAQGHDLGLHLRWSAGRSPVWARGAIVQAGIALGQVAGDPAGGALTRDAHLGRDMSAGTVVVQDTVHQCAAAMNGQAGVTVRH